MKIVVVAHDCSRTGGTILLLRLLTIINALPNVKLVTIIKQDGPLAKEFQNYGRTIQYPAKFWSFSSSKSKLVLFLRYLIHPLRMLLFKIRFERLTSSAEIVFSNTITNGEILRLANLSGAVVFSYIHELKFITSYFNKRENVQFLLDHSQYVLIPSYSVGRFLENEFNLKTQNIRMLNYLIDVNEVQLHSKSTNNLSWEKPKEVFLVVGCGTSDLRKGYDKFYQTASYLRDIRTPFDFHFLWIGASENDQLFHHSQHDIAKLNLSTFITVLPSVENPLPYLANANIFYLCSREDPFPLVVLEAAALKVPTICFSEGGGIVEFVEDDAGWIVPYLNCIEAARKISYLIDHKSDLRRAGENAFLKVSQRHNKDVVRSQLVELIAEATKPS